MGERITIVGGTDSSVAVTLDGTQAISLANQFSKDLYNYYEDNKLNVLDVTDAPAVNDQINYGMISQGGAYTAGNGYDYIVAGGMNKIPDGMPIVGTIDPNDASLLVPAVTINSVMDSNQFVRVLAGNVENFTYNAGQEGGQLAAGNINNSVRFNGNTVNGGNWDIRTGRGNDTIITGSGNNTVYASYGENVIDVSAGRVNSVYSQGADSITASEDSNALNRVTLLGGTSPDSYTTVNLNKGAVVMDLSSYNVVTVGGGGSIVGGLYGNYTFDGSYNSDMNNMNGGTESTINATGNINIIHGDTNTISATKGMTFLNGTGDMLADVLGQAVAFGAEGLNLTLNAKGDASGLFVADTGNETLNASGSTAAVQIYANTVVGAQNGFVATGGSGDDLLVAGTGDATFTGGAGNNEFAINKGTVSGDGNTVITDFARAGSDNKIALNNYGLDENSMNDLLRNSQNDANGNAVLHLVDGHTVTIEGVSVDSLHANNFKY